MIDSLVSSKREGVNGPGSVLGSLVCRVLNEVRSRPELLSSNKIREVGPISAYLGTGLASKCLMLHAR